MKILKKLLLCGVMMVGIISCFTGCGKEETPAIDETLIITSLKESIKKDMSYDNIANITYQPVESNEEEINKLKEIYTSQVPYTTYECSASLSSVDMDADVQYRILLAYNEEWKCVYYAPFNENEWEYEAKSQVNNKRIMDDLCSYSFGSFEKNYVGNDRYSSIEITDRNFDKSINRDTIDLNVTAKLDFGTVEFHVNVIYYFVRGEWVVGDLVADEQSEWKLNIESGYELNELTDDEIIKKLTTKNEFLTYVANNKYFQKCSLTKDYYDCHGSEMYVHHTFHTEYEDIGSVDYEIIAYYEWLAYEWSEPEITVLFKSFDFNEIIGKTFVDSKGNKLILEKITEPSNELSDKASRDFHFSYYDGKNASEFNGNFIVVLRDNTWECVLDEDNPLGYTTLSLCVDSKSFVSNDSVRYYMVNEPDQPTEETTSEVTSDESEPGIEEETSSNEENLEGEPETPETEETTAETTVPSDDNMEPSDIVSE